MYMYRLDKQNSYTHCAAQTTCIHIYRERRNFRPVKYQLSTRKINFRPSLISTNGRGCNKRS